MAATKPIKRLFEDVGADEAREGAMRKMPSMAVTITPEPLREDLGDRAVKQRRAHEEGASEEVYHADSLFCSSAFSRRDSSPLRTKYDRITNIMTKPSMISTMLAVCPTSAPL